MQLKCFHHLKLLAKFSARNGTKLQNLGVSYCSSDAALRHTHALYCTAGWSSGCLTCQTAILFFRPNSDMNWPATCATMSIIKLWTLLSLWIIHHIKMKEYLLSIFTVDCLPHIAGVGNHQGVAHSYCNIKSWFRLLTYLACKGRLCSRINDCTKHPIGIKGVCDKLHV